MSTGIRPGFVFISYKSEEAHLTAQLREALKDEGFNVWWDEELQCGHAWAEKLDEAVQEAACIIVLWSNRALASQWVCHEASQAIARNVYAPVRVELVKLESPYDRIQATELVDWDGDRTHAGYRRLIERVDALVPASVSLHARLLRWLQVHFWTLIASSIALFAIALLTTIYIEQRSDHLEKVYNCTVGAQIRTELAMESYLRGESLDRTCLSSAELTDVDLSGASLYLAKLTDATLTNAKLIDASLEKADLDGATLTLAKLDKANVRSANVSGADLTMAVLTGTDLADTDFTAANLTGANFTRAALVGTNLTRTDLMVAVLEEADLTDANLTDAKLIGANLIGANLTNANLTGADLTRANLTSANFTGANILSTDLTDTCADELPKGWPEFYKQLPVCPVEEESRIEQ